MMLIKLFEEYTGEWYQRITENKYWGLSKESITFPSKEIDTLILILKKRSRSNVYKWPSSDRYDRKNRVSIYINGDITLNFTKIKDDYYLVWLFNSNRNTFYKCDQLDGLISFIEDFSW